MVAVMGASQWHARVPYQDDIGAALQQARQNAYDQQDFYQVAPGEKARSMSEPEYVAWGIEQLKAVFPDDDSWEPAGEECRDEWRAAQVVVTGPDSLLESQPFSGTHSVIDMTHVADEPDYHAVAPAPAESLQELFGTTQPAVHRHREYHRANAAADATLNRSATKPPSTAPRTGLRDATAAQGNINVTMP